MIILLDQDGVLAQCHQKVLEIYEEDYGDVPFKEPTEYWMELNFEDPELAKQNIFEIFKRPGLFASFDVQPGAQQAVTEMIEEGYEVYFCTTPMWSNPTCLSDKVNWIDKHFFGLGSKTYLCQNKRLVHGDILVDDKPHLDGHHVPSWQRVVFDQEYNQMVNDPRISRDWSNWREAFAKVER